MITAVRLRPFNRKAGMGKKTHTSFHLGKKYSVAPYQGQPSPVYIVNDRTELAELRKIAQFEIMQFEDRADLDNFLANEVMSAARLGHQMFPAPVIGEKKPAAVQAEVAGRIFETEDAPEDDAAVPVDEEEDDGDTETYDENSDEPPPAPVNTGRAPKLPPMPKKPKPAAKPSKKAAAKKAAKKKGGAKKKSKR